MKPVLMFFAGFAIAVCCVAVRAQVPATPVGGSVTLVAQAELAVAKAELEVTRKYQEHLLATVYWSLGTLAAVAVLLVGYSWWNNSRNYDRERLAFEREAGARLNEMVAKIGEELRATLQAKAESLEQKVGQQARESEERVLSALKARLDEAKKEGANQHSQVKTSLSELRGEVDLLHLVAQLEKHRKTRAEGIFRNALQDSVTALEMALKLNDEYEVGNVLDLVAEDVRVILTGKDLPIDNFLIGQLIEALDRVKGSHAHAAAALKSKAPGMLNK